MRSAFAAVAAVALCSGIARADSYSDFNAAIESRGHQNWADVDKYISQALAAGDLPAHLVPTAYLIRGQSYMVEKRYDLAEADLDAALKLWPGDPTLLVYRAHDYELERKYGDAVADFSTVLGQQPYLAAVTAVRIPAYELNGQYDLALADIDRMIAKFPEESAWQRSRGIALWGQGKFDDAAREFAQAHDANSKEAYVVLWMKLVDMKTGHSAVDLKGLSSDLDLTAWPGPIVTYFLGNTTQDKVFAAATAGDKGDFKGDECEANFYIGEWDAARGDAASAKPLLQTATDICPVDYVEAPSAATALKGLP